MSGHDLLASARRAAGLTQDALARLAGTSQPPCRPTSAARSHPSLAVAERIIEATGHRLEVAPNLEFVEVPGQHGLHPFWLAKRLWRLDPERALSTVLLPGPLHHWPVPRRQYHLHDRTDRARAYELILREGSPHDLLDYVDGALLVDIWKDLDLPDPSAAPGSHSSAAPGSHSSAKPCRRAAGRERPAKEATPHLGHSYDCDPANEPSTYGQGTTPLTTRPATEPGPFHGHCSWSCRHV